MYNGYGGMNGGYGGRGGGNGQEMMIIVVCCICCLCLASIAGGYWANLFCGMSSSLGRSCSPKETAGPTYVSPPTEPAGPTYSTSTCNPTFAAAVRRGSDPRPPLNASACVNSAQITGRDGFFWTVQADPQSGLAKWVRVTSSALADARDGTVTTPEINCPALIDFTQLPAYSDNNPTSLIAKCSVSPVTATTKEATVALVSSAGRRIGAGLVNGGWNDINSKVWYRESAKWIGQRDLAAIVENTVKAATLVKNKLKRNQLTKATFATMLEAAVRNKDNSADYIYSVTLNWSWTGTNEEGYLAYLNGLHGNRLMDWSKVIDNPKYFVGL